MFIVHQSFGHVALTIAYLQSNRTVECLYEDPLVEVGSRNPFISRILAISSLLNLHSHYKSLALGTPRVCPVPRYSFESSGGPGIHGHRHTSTLCGGLNPM